MSDNLFEPCAVAACAQPVALLGDVCEGCQTAFGPMLKGGQQYRSCTYPVCGRPALVDDNLCDQHRERASTILSMILDPELRERMTAASYARKFRARAIEMPDCQQHSAAGTRGGGQ